MEFNDRWHMQVPSSTEDWFVTQNSESKNTHASDLVAVMKLVITFFVPKDIGSVVDM